MFHRGQLRRLYRPHTIAVVRASASFEKAGPQLIHALREFSGELFAIDPTTQEIQGRKAYSDLASTPKCPDFVIVEVPATSTPRVIRQAAEAHAGGALVIGGGFAETGGADAALQVGPNTSGFFDQARRCYVTCAPKTETVGESSVAVVDQSGGVNLKLASKGRIHAA